MADESRLGVTTPDDRPPDAAHERAHPETGRTDL
jgi:hypothetical protein